MLTRSRVLVPEPAERGVGALMLWPKVDFCWQEVRKGCRFVQTKAWVADEKSWGTKVLVGNEVCQRAAVAS